MRHTHPVQQRAHQPARCEYNVEALVQPPQVAAERALGEPLAEASAEDLREIGVIERRYGNPPPLRDAPGGPRRLKRVTDFDEARLQRLQHPGPALRIQG